MTEVLPPTPSAAGTSSAKLDRRILAIGSVVVLGAIMAMLDITVEAYSSTFVWALVLLAVAFLPALLLPRGKTTPVTLEGTVLPEAAEPPPVIDAEPGTKSEPAADRR